MGIKNILSGLENTFKSIISSPAKLALTAAAVYVGGGAMGYWETPFESINGAWTDTGSTSGAGASGALSGGSALQNITDFGAAKPGIAEGLLGSAGPQTFASPADNPTLSMTGQPAPPMTPGMTTPQNNMWANATPKPGLINSFLGETGDFIKKNPIPSMMVGNAVANAFQPNAMDVLKEKAKLEREEYDRRRAIANQNMQVGNVNLGLPRRAP